MDALVTAGGIPEPGEPLYVYTQGIYKALLDVAGKPMIQWVLDALSESRTVEQVVVVGLPDGSGVTCARPVTFIPNEGAMLDNIRSGVQKVLELNPSARHVLVVSSDIPGITGAMIDWVVNAALETDQDVYYNVVTRQVMETRYPASKRSYTRLKETEVCGGDMNVIRAQMVTGKEALWERLIASRKNALKQAGMIGYSTLLLLLMRRLTMESAVKRVSKRLDISGRLILCPYAEVAMDVDKPHQLELMRADLARRVPV